MAHAFGFGSVATRLLTLGVLAGLTVVNLGGLAKLTAIEIVIVSANLFVLGVLAVVGMAEWSPLELSQTADSKPIGAALMGAAAIFVSYEGFQLLTYEYDDLDQPKRFLTPVLVIASSFVALVYVGVALGATMLVGADAVVGQASVALSVAAEEKFGTAGLAVMTVAAAFATSAAINSTLFSSGKLAERVARDDARSCASDRSRLGNVRPGAGVTGQCRRDVRGPALWGAAPSESRTGGSALNSM